ncbi:porin family protein [Celeribacter neptunius]|uniref:porin family protein n=1 Tax=Celeribacter neptunius TaxID=588602 RepID=UPI0015A5D07A|nr:porin family protein [Celeribacter neptunius]
MSVPETYELLIQKGRAVLTEGAPAKSVSYFAKAWHLAPTDPTAQLAIAEAWAQAGQQRRAEAFLRHLLADPTQQENAALYLAALSELARRYPLQFSASFALLPSTNIKNTSSEPYFDTLWGRFLIDDGGKETSGVGVEAAAQLLYRRPISHGLSVELGSSLRRIWYPEPELRYWRGRLSVDLKSDVQASSFRAGLHADRVYYSEVEEPSSDRLSTGLHGSWSRRLSGAETLSASGVIEYRDYLDKDTLSGRYGSLGLGWSKRVMATGGLTLGGTLERSTPSLEYHRYWGASLRAGYNFDLSDTLRAGVDFGATLRQYDTAFPSVDFARRDEIYRIGVSLSSSRIKIMGSTPKLSCSYKVQTSNIALYSSETTDCRIGWNYRF